MNLKGLILDLPFLSTFGVTAQLPEAPEGSRIRADSSKGDAASKSPAALEHVTHVTVTLVTDETNQTV